MIKFFEKGDKKHLKRVLTNVYGCQNVEQMSNKELTFCYIAKTLESLQNFCEMVESAETDLAYKIERLEKKLKKLKKLKNMKK